MGDVSTTITLDLIDMEIELLAHITPYTPARGPSFDCAGGEPAEGGDIVDIQYFLSIPQGKGKPAQLVRIPEEFISEDDRGRVEEELRIAHADDMRGGSCREWDEDKER